MSKIIDIIKRKTIPEIFRIILNRFFKINIDSYILFQYNFLTPLHIPIKYSRNFHKIKELTFKDFSKSDYINENKLEIIKNRFKDPHYKAFGIFEGDILTYWSWITYRSFMLPNGNEFNLNEYEALIEDSFCVPKFRNEGRHTLMNYFCLNLFFKEGIESANIIVMKNNKCAQKVQINIGFDKKLTFKSGKIFGIPFTKNLHYASNQK